MKFRFSLRSSIAATVWAAALFAGLGVASAQTLTLWTFLNPNGTNGREVALKDLISSYEGENPGVKIVVEPQVWSELTNKFVLSSNIGNAPDLVFTHGNNLRLLAESGAAADLDAGVVSKWSDAERADFLYDSLLDKARIDGKLLGVPVFPFASVLYYRRDLLEQAGFTEADLATWDGFVDALQAVKTDRITGTTIPLSPDRPTQTVLLTHLVDAQGDLFEEGCKPQLANEAGVAALTFQAALFGEDGIASREDISRNLDDSWDLFMAGRTASIINASTRAGQIEGTAAWDASALGIAPLPGIENGKAGPSVVNSWYVSVSEKSGNKDAAFDFANYLVGTEGARAWALTGQQPPVRRSVLDDPAMDAPEFAQLKQIGEAIAAATINLPAECRVDRIFSDLNTATQKVLVDGADPQAALQAAEAAFADRN